MPFFFIVPIWVFCVAVGVAFLFFRNLRRFGIYVIAVPAGVTLVSFALLTSALYLVPRISHGPHPQWFGVALIGGYLIALVFGAVFGALRAFLLLMKVPTSKRV